MNVKNNIKKVSAVLASAALVATTLVGAMAYDLSDYPAPFVENGIAAGAIVVGANAQTQDVIGAIDIAASLQAAAKTASTTAGSTVVTVDGGKDFNLVPNTASSAVTYDDADLDGFVDSSAELEDIDYDFHEEVKIGTGLEIRTSIDTSYSEEDNYGLEPWMEIAEDSLTYQIVFDDPVLLSDFGTSSDNQEMDIDFAGKAITLADATATSLTVESSSEFFMQEDDSVTVDGHEITLKRVGASSVLVSVDGQTLAVNDDGSTEQFDQADDFEVEVQSMFYIEGADDNSATLKLGSVISKTYNNDDALEIFGGSDDSDESTWKWSIVGNATHLTSFGAVLNIDNERSNDNNDPEKRAAIAFGDELALPNNYGAVSFAGWDDNSMTKYDSLDFEFDTVDLDTNQDVDVLKITSSADDAFEFSGNDASTIYVPATGNIWYKDGTDEVDSNVNTTNFVLDNDATTVVRTDATTLTVTFVNGDALVLDLDSSMTFFGTLEGESEAAEFAYTDANGGTVSGTEDELMLSSYGVKMDDIDSQMQNDELSLMVPFDGLNAEIVVKSAGSVVSAGADGAVSYSVNPIALGLGMLDTDAPALGSKPMIIVGGPAANTVAAEFLGNPTSEEVLATFSEGKALIRYDDANKAMLVAGWGAMETQGAANVVAKYGSYDFSGAELEVVVTDLSNVVVNSVN